MLNLIGCIGYIIGASIIWNITDGFWLPLLAMFLCYFGGALIGYE